MDTGNTRFRQQRQKRQLAQARLAVLAGVSPNLIVSVERHGHLPTPAVRARLAAALDVQMHALWPDADTRRARTQKAGLE